MFDQKFAVTIVYSHDLNISTEDVRTWLKEKLEGKIQNFRFRAENYGSSSSGRTFEGHIYITNDVNVEMSMLKSYIETPGDAKFRFDKIVRM